MPIKIQYNKTSLHQLIKDLLVRENALPVLLAKESALRFEVKRAHHELIALDAEIEREFAKEKEGVRLWCEFDENIMHVEEVAVGVKTIAGVKTPLLKNIRFTTHAYSVFEKPFWIPSGIERLKRLATLVITQEIALKKQQILETARKKTTQKVNLYQKVLIPEYQEAIRKIKRFLEDEENLSKSSQKILKTRMAMAEAAAA